MTARIGKVTGQGSGRFISNFALQHLNAAITFRDKVCSIEEVYKDQELSGFFSEISSYSSACIMSAAASLEALINELFIYHSGELRSSIDDFENTFWGRRGIERKPILEKYQLALELLGHEKIDQSSQKYKDASSLIELRNSLVHFKPLWDGEQNRIIELRELLEGRFETSPFVDNGADFVSVKCMSAGCVKWVITSLFSFIREFDQRASLAPKKMEALFRLET